VEFLEIKMSLNFSYTESQIKVVKTIVQSLYRIVISYIISSSNLKNIIVAND